MTLLLGQLVYTSFAGSGLKILASADISQQIEQAFLQKIAFKYWNSYNPPAPGYRAVYLLQLDQGTLFGWLYNEQTDDLGRSHLPYFICYYLAGALVNFKLDSILNCLQKGPVTLVDWQNPPAALDNLAIANLHYEPPRLGVAISAQIRIDSHRVLRKKQLLNLFIPDQKSVTAQAAKMHEAVFSPAEQAERQRIRNNFPEQTTSAQAQPHRSANQPAKSRISLPTDKIQIMLGIAIATTTFALLGLIYSLLTTTPIFAPKQSESSLSGRSLIVKT